MSGVRLEEIVGKPLSGEWGNEDVTGNGISVLRTTNFTNEGVISFENVVTRDIPLEKVRNKILQPGDIIIEKSGGSDKQPVGRVVYFDRSDGQYIFNNFTGLLRIADTSVWNPKYVFYALFQNYMCGGTKKFQNKTTGLHNLKLNLYVKNFSIYPREMVEQEKIVRVLDKICSLIEIREQELQKLDELVKSRFIEMTNSNESILVRMGDIATYVNGFAFKPKNWAETGKPIIRIQNLNDSNAKYNFYDGILDEKYAVRKGDVLISWATHLEAYIWNGEDAWLNQHIFKVIFNKMDVDKSYFVYATESALKQAFRNAHGFKPTMEHIKRSDFENAIVRLPHLIIQKEFSTFREKTNKSKTAIQKSLDDLETLKKSLMQQYFA